jgi:selenocysteine lyase/cysteine desulfurase
MKNLTRRQMLGGIAAAATFVTARPLSAASHPDVVEYGFAPGLIYLNTGSLGPTPRHVFEEVAKAWNELEMNPVREGYGGNTLKVADSTREAVAGLINCTADEVLLTRSTTNAITTAGLAMVLDRGDRILTTDVEHDGGSAVWKHLENRRGVVIDRVSIPPNDHDAAGIVRRFETAIKKDTRVISVSQVVTSTGFRMPVHEIVAVAKGRNILTVVDGAQAVGNTPVDVRSIGCDAYAAPGHKWLLAPKGTGFLYINKDSASKIQPVEWTDGKGYVTGSAGMGSLPLMAGLGAAIRAAQKRGIAASEERNLALRNYAYEGLKKIAKARLVSAPPGPLATALVAFEVPAGVDSSALRNTIAQKHKIVLKMTEKRWGNGLRISPHVFNTRSDIDAALKAIATELG